MYKKIIDHLRELHPEMEAIDRRWQEGEITQESYLTLLLELVYKKHVKESNPPPAIKYLHLIREKLGEEGEYSICRSDGEPMGFGDIYLWGEIFIFVNELLNGNHKANQLDWSE
jgi:hypothetical protein